MAKVTATKRPAIYTVVLNLNEAQASAMLDQYESFVEAGEVYSADGVYFWETDEVEEGIVQALRDAGVTTDLSNGT